MTSKNSKTSKTSNKEELFFGIFKKTDLLSYSQMKILLDKSFPNEKAKVVGSCLLKHCVYADEKLYIILNETNIYEVVSKGDVIERKVKTLVSKLVEASFKNMTEEQQDYIQNCKSFERVKSSYGVKDYYDELIEYISDNKIKMDENTKYQLHFLNGYVDLKTGELHKRVVGKDYITYCIPRNYKASSETSKQKIYSIINKIWFLEDDRNYSLSQIGRAISGDSGKEMTNVFWLGTGSSGKSFIMKMCMASLDKYVLELKPDSFEMNNPKQDKIMNEYDRNKSVRITWVNEMSDKRIDTSLYKQFCEGVLQTSKVYKDGSYSVIHNSKLFCTSNDMPNVPIDSGVSRRLLAYYFKSEFVKETERVNEAKHIYLRDDDLLTSLKDDDDLLNGFTDILIQYCKNWCENKAPAIPASYTEAKQTVQSANNKTEDFIDRYLVITGNEFDRISKDKMREYYLQMYPDTHATVQQIISKLKDFKIEYSSQLRVSGGNKGVFVGVALKNQLDEIMTEKEKELREEIERLKKEVEELKKSKNENTTQTKTEPVIINKSKKEVIDHLFDDITNSSTQSVDSENDNDNESKDNAIFGKLFSDVKVIQKKKKTKLFKKN